MRCVVPAAEREKRFLEQQSQSDDDSEAEGNLQNLRPPDGLLRKVDVLALNPEHKRQTNGSAKHRVGGLCAVRGELQNRVRGQRNQFDEQQQRNADGKEQTKQRDEPLRVAPRAVEQRIC